MQYCNGIIACRGCAYDTFVSEPMSSSKSFTFMCFYIKKKYSPDVCNMVVDTNDTLLTKIVFVCYHDN